MKNLYMNPEMEIVMISAEDVIATSITLDEGVVGPGADKDWNA